jgi:hypothetical protein
MVVGESDRHPSVEPHGRFQFGLSRLFRIQFGLAGLAAVATYVHAMPPTFYGKSISWIAFLIATSLASVVAYLVALAYVVAYSVARQLPGQLAVRLAVLASGGVVGAFFARPKADESGWLLLLGAGVAMSWLVALGPIDRANRQARIETAASTPSFHLDKNESSDLPH